jgi:hypothetical protein
MIAEITHTQNGIEQKLSIELDELGVLIIGMNKSHLEYISDKKRKTLLSTQNELIALCIDTETPIVLYHNPIYGKISGLLQKKLFSYHLFENIEESPGNYSNLIDEIKRREIKYPIFTGINLSNIEDISQAIHPEITEIITSEKLIASPENNKLASKNQIEWFENNGLYFPNHEDLLDIIYKKNQ